MDKLNQEQVESFERVTNVVSDWLHEHGHPHLVVLISQGGVELIEGIRCHPNPRYEEGQPDSQSSVKSARGDKYDGSWVADITQRLGFTGLDYAHNLDNVDSGEYWVRFDIDECDTDNLTRMITEELQEAGLELNDGVYEHDCVSGNVDLRTPED